MQLTVSILGPLQVHADDTPVPIGGARLRALLIRLALDPGRSVSVAALTDALWNETPPDGAANALQSLISRLRRALGTPDTPDTVIGDISGYHLALPPQAIDAHRFETLARQGHHADNPATTRQLLREALALWRGPALADVADTGFALAPAARLDEMRLTALSGRLDAELRLGLHADALPELEALAAEHPLRENIAALLMRALYASGRQADALAVYERVRTALSNQLGIDPAGELADTHLAILRNDPALTPDIPAVSQSARRSGAPDRDPGSGTAAEATASGRTAATTAATTSAAETTPSHRTNLRNRLTSFVGRDEEITRIAKTLQTSRLVTLVGPGGAGKTRLATETATHLLANQLQDPDLPDLPGLPDLPDGAWLVELAPVTDPAELPQAVLTALGQRETHVLRTEQPGTAARDALTRVTQGLAGQQLLVVLDNCEHLIDAAAHVAEHLLENVPGLRVIATSREPLGILGENLLPVLSLDQPDDDTLAAEALASPAVHLFADRAAAVHPGFAVHDANVADIVQICRRLDGLPLAIELAAARLRTLPLHAIADRLDNRFRLLTGGSRTAMPRHQTLRAVVAWSWELLSDDERDLAERLSVFPGGITAASAAAVHDSTGPDTGTATNAATDTDDLLAALVDKSLLHPIHPDATHTPGTPHADTTPRYRMLETLREYGTEQLTAAGTLTDVRRAHSRYFRDLAEQAEPHLRRREQLTWLARLDADHDNILAALRYAADNHDADTAIRIAAALAWYWSIVGQTTEGRTWLELALSVDGDSPAEAHAVVKILHALTGLFSAQDWTDLTDITDALAGVIADPGVPHDNPLLAIAACTIPIVTDDLPAVLAAVTIHENHPDPWVRGMLHLMRGMAAENHGDLATQRRDLEQARHRFTQIGERWGLSGTLSALAAMAMADGDIPQAMRLQDEALTLLREVNAADDAAQVQMMRATALARIGNQDEAKALVASILESARRNRSQPAMLLAYIGLADIARAEGDTDTAWANLRASDDVTLRQWQGPPQLLAVREVTRSLLYLDDAGGPGTAAAATTDVADVADVAGARADAKLALREAYRLGAAAHDMPVLSRIAIGTAYYADITGDPHTAAQLLGTADALRGGTDLGDPDRANAAASVRAQLGDEDYDATFALGRAIERKEGLEAIALYLGIDPSVPAKPRRLAEENHAPER